jgi:sec-independent protein translocase protein TatC
VAYAFKEKLFDILTRPLISVMPPNAKLIYTGLPEAFFTYIKVALLTGVLFAIPVLAYEFWMFVAPGLYKKERMLFGPFILLTILFFVAGALFGYYLVLPFGYKFFIGFSSDTIQVMPSMKEYLGLTSQMLLAFGLIFELPVVITCLSAIGLVSVDFLKKSRKYAVVIAFIAGGILTPTPDVICQSLMAGPLILLYEVSIIGARIFGRKKEEEIEAEAVEENESTALETTKSGE